jgi:hypothetical protein
LASDQNLIQTWQHGCQNLELYHLQDSPARISQHFRAHFSASQNQTLNIPIIYVSNGNNVPPVLFMKKKWKELKIVRTVIKRRTKHTPQINAYRADPMPSFQHQLWPTTWNQDLKGPFHPSAKNKGNNLKTVSPKQRKETIIW